MKVTSLKQLQEGVMIRNKLTENVFFVSENHGSYAVGVRTTVITNPEDWEIIMRPGEQCLNDAPKPKDYEYCPHCKGSFSYNKPGKQYTCPYCWKDVRKS